MGGAEQAGRMKRMQTSNSEEMLFAVKEVLNTILKGPLDNIQEAQLSIVAGRNKLMATDRGVLLGRNWTELRENHRLE